MGQKSSKQNKEKKARIEQTLKEEQQVDTSNFKISNQELIFEKYGRIQQEYTLMNVPLGKGSYGEVRKGVHKKTGQQRAVKIIDKSQCKPEEDEDIMKKVEKGVFTFPKDDWKDITIEAQQMICKMLTMDPQKRYSAEEALQDPWIKKFRQLQQVDMPNLIRSLNNMKTFRAGKKLQEAVWMFIVNYLATKEEKNELLKTFQSLDANGDGKLSREELINGYSKILTMENAIKEVDKIMKVIDKNDNGDIDYSEWVAATISREQLLSVQRLEMAFNIFDKDGSGSLQLSEFKEIFGGAGVSEDVWKAVIKEVDKNGDGEISYQEFKEMMLKYIKDEE
ncbi:hypothetical protein ABPG74_010732 [Tetrahymena malaccensis]